MGGARKGLAKSRVTWEFALLLPGSHLGTRAICALLTGTT
ncbi:hypothetical protein BH23ACT5_BH23ACT5_07040 [soil metagenome]